MHAPSPSPLRTLALAAALACALSMQAQAQGGPRSYDLPAQPLGSALARIAADSGQQISIDAELVRGHSAPPVRGSYTAEQAARAALAGSGLELVRTGGGNWALRRVPVAAPMSAPGAATATLAEVRVTAQAERSATSEGSKTYAAGPSKGSTGLALTLRETPQSVSVITRQRIEDQALVDLNETLRNTPGVSVKASDRGRSEYFSRGFSIFNFQIDGVPTIAGATYDTDNLSTVIFDRVEMLRGASGLQSGAGYPSGTINMVRKHANSKVFTGSVALEAGSWKRHGGTVDLSTPLNADGSVRGRAVFSYRDQEGFVDFEDKQTTVFYAALDADLSSATKVSLGFSDQRDYRNGTYWGGLPVWYTDGTRTNWSRSKTTQAKWGQWDDHTQSLFAGLQHRLDNGWALQLDAQHSRTDEITNLVWMSGRPDRDTGLGMEASPILYTGNPKQSRFNVQASGTFHLFGREHDATVGAAYVQGKYGYNSADLAGDAAPVGNFHLWDGNYPAPVYGPEYVGNLQRMKQTAAYGAVRLSLADPLKVIAGARVTRYQYNADVMWGAPPSELNESGVFTPYLGVLYDFNDWLTGYASYTSIFNPQSNRDRIGKQLDPLEGNNYETGLKGEFFDGALNASLAVFRIRQDNFAVLDGDALVPGTTDPAYIGEKGIKSDGYELEVVGKLRPNWDLGLSWTTYSAKRPDGTRVTPRFPSRMLKLFTKYELGGALKGLSLGGGVDWQNDMPHLQKNPVTGVQEDIGQRAYALVNLMARYQIDKALSVQANIYNLFDKKYHENNWGGSFTYGEPRRVLVTMNYKF